MILPDYVNAESGDGPCNGGGLFFRGGTWEHYDDLDNNIGKMAVEAMALPLGIWCFLRWVLACRDEQDAYDLGSSLF